MTTERRWAVSDSARRSPQPAEATDAIRFCPHCGKETDIFSTGGAERCAADLAVPFLGRIPIDATIRVTYDRVTRLAAMLRTPRGLVAL